MRIEFEEYRLKLEGMRAELEDLASALGLSKLQSEVEQLEKQAAQEGFWDDLANSQKVLQKTKQAKHKIEKYQSLYAKWEDACTLVQLAIEAGDDDMLDEVIAEHDAVAQQLEEHAPVNAADSGEYDSLQRHFGLPCRAPAAPRRRTGRRCSTACIPAGPSATASNIKILDYLDGDEAGHQKRLHPDRGAECLRLPQERERGAPPGARVAL